jgi:hypothetical protein
MTFTNSRLQRLRCLANIKFSTARPLDRRLKSNSGHGCLSALFMFLLLCVRRGLAIIRDFSEDFYEMSRILVFSEINSELEHSSGPGP